MVVRILILSVKYRFFLVLPYFFLFYLVCTQFVPINSASIVFSHSQFMVEIYFLLEELKINISINVQK